MTAPATAEARSVAGPLPAVPLAQDALSPVVTDGVRYAVYEASASTTRVIDTATGSSFDVETPPGCSSRPVTYPPQGPAALGGGQLIWGCGQMLDLATRTVHEPVGYAAYQQGNPALENRPIDVGADWIRFATYDNHVVGLPAYLNWHTGVWTADFPGDENDRPPDVFEPSVFADLDAPGLVHALCPPVKRKVFLDDGDTEVGPSVDPDVTQQYPWTVDGIRVQRCGSRTTWSLARYPGSSQMGAGLVSYGEGGETGRDTSHVVRLGTGQQWTSAGSSLSGHTATRLYGSVAHGVETGVVTYDLVQATIPPPPPFAGALRPGAAIGPVTLGERRARVRHSLGRGEAKPHGRVDYATARLRLTVTYDSKGRVTRIATPTPRVQLNGYPLAAGYAFFHAALKRWRVGRQGLTSPHRPHGPTTVLRWRDGRLLSAAMSRP